MPMRVWDNQQQKARTVSEAEAQKGIAEGRYQIRSGIEIPVVAPDGRKGTIPSDNAADAFSKGFSLETPEQVRDTFDRAAEKSRKAVAKDMEGTAFLQGALKTATFGLSDAGIQAFTDIEPEMQTAVQEENPIASTLGEVAGALPIAGPAAAAARGTAALGKMAGTSKIGQKAAEFAADGLAYGMGESISDLSLGRPEEVAGNLIMGGAIGGVLGGTVGALAPVAKAAKDSVLSATEAAIVRPTTSLAKAVAKKKTKSMGVEGAEELIESGRFRDVQDPGKIKSFQEQAKNTAVDVRAFEKQEKQIAQELKQFHKEQVKTLKELQKTTMKDKAAELDEVIQRAEASQKASTKEASQALGESINDIETIATNTFAEIKNKVAQDVTPLSAGQVKNLAELSDDLSLALEKMPQGPVATDLSDRLLRIQTGLTLPNAKVQDVIPELWDTKQLLTKNINWKADRLSDFDQTLANMAKSADDAIKGTKSVSAGEIDLANKLYTQRSALMKMTRKMRTPDMVDMDATRRKNLLDTDKLAANIIRDPEGKAQMGIVFNKMSEFYQLLDVDPKYLEKVKSKVAAAGAGKAQIDKQKLFKKESIENLKSQLHNDLSEFKSADVNEIADLVLDMASSPANLKDKTNTLLKLREAQEYISSNPNLNTVEKYAHYTKVLGDQAGEERVRKLLQFQKDMSVMDQMKGESPGWMMRAGILSSAIAGGADAGIMAATVAKAAHLANSPKAALEVIPTVEKFASTGRNVVDKFISGFSKAMTSKTAARTVYAPYGRSEYEKRAKAIERNRDPVAFQERLTEAFEPLAAAPNIQNQLMMKTVQTQQFLDDKLPKDPLAGQSVWTPPYKPSETEMNTWMRRFDIAENPAAILPKIEDGTVIPEEVETMKALHPALFEETKRRMITELAQLEEPPPYNKLVTLSFVFETAMDPSLNSEYVMFMQELIANYPRDKVQSNKSMSKLDPKTFLSDSQQVTMR